MAHTPTPWRQFQGYPDELRGPSGEMIAATYSGPCEAGNMKLIVRAVNSFEAMREALLAVANDEGLADVIAGIGEQPPFMNQIRAALAMADKEQP